MCSTSDEEGMKNKDCPGRMQNGKYYVNINVNQKESGAVK